MTGYDRYYGGCEWGCQHKRITGLLYSGEIECSATSTKRFARKKSVAVNGRRHQSVSMVPRLFRGGFLPEGRAIIRRFSRGAAAMVSPLGAVVPPASTDAVGGGRRREECDHRWPARLLLGGHSHQKLRSCPPRCDAQSIESGCVAVSVCCPSAVSR